MTKQVQRRRGTATQHTSFTGAEGEISVNTTNKSVHVHDGTTAGGIEAARADLGNVSDADLNTALSGNTLASLTITSADINGGTIDGTVIGGTTAAAITGTTITGTSFASSGDMTFGDNDKAIFGAGSDLQIYHDGSNSYVQDAGSGNLYLRQNGTAVIIDDGTNNLAAFNSVSGESALYYGGSGKKLATTSTGIDVTGTVTADGLTVDGAIQVNATVPSIVLEETDTTDINGQVAVVSGNTHIRTINDAGNSVTNRVTVSNSTGDISFYEDTGTTPKFFWDASAESLGIGTSSPLNKLSVGSTSDANTAVSINSTSSGFGTLRFNDDASESGQGRIFYDHTNNALGFTVNSSERLRIDSSGNVGIGSTSPNYPLTIRRAGDGIKFEVTDTVDANYRIQVSGSNIITGPSTSSAYVFQTGNTERMRITSSGNVGIGTTNPSAKLHVRDAVDTNAASGTGVALFQGAASTYSGRIGLDATGMSIGTDNASRALMLVAGGSERMRIDSSGNLLVGGTTTNHQDGSTQEQFSYINGSYMAVSRSQGTVAYLNRQSTDGSIVDFRKDGTTVGSIGTYVGYTTIGSDDTGLMFVADTNYIGPRNASTGANRDNAIDLGNSGSRFDDIYATNGTIQTSDRNEKQDIDVLSDAEQRVAVACKGLLRKFRWKDAVAEKGDAARIHFGIIAQDLQDAFAAEGLDAGHYAMFIHSTWTDEETGEERSRMGVRYPELLAFIIAAI